MKLNYNCIRDVMLVCEDLLVLTPDLEFECISPDDIHSTIPSYSIEEIVYVLMLLDEAGYLHCLYSESDDQISEMTVLRLTYSGHQLLDTIRPEPIWKKTINILSKAGAVTLPLISDTASSLLTSLISGFLSQESSSGNQ